LLLLPQERKGEIRGFVVDNRREPTHSSQVVLRGEGLERTEQSDNAGRYQFIGVPAGEYELTISAPFFNPSTIRMVHLQGNAVRVLPGNARSSVESSGSRVTHFTTPFFAGQLPSWKV
jgi:hypothetical protein